MAYLGEKSFSHKLLCLIELKRGKPLFEVEHRHFYKVGDRFPVDFHILGILYHNKQYQFLYHLEL